MSIYRYSKSEVRKRLREEAERLCKELAPLAVQITVILPLDKVTVSISCKEYYFSK